MECWFTFWGSKIQLFRLPAGQAPAGGGLCWCSAWCWSGPTNPPNAQLEGKDKRVLSAWLARLSAAPPTIAHHVLCPRFVSKPHSISNTEIESFPRRPLQDYKADDGIIFRILFSQFQRPRMHQSQLFQLDTYPLTQFALSSILKGNVFLWRIDTCSSL